jgi:hypothetical protein
MKVIVSCDVELYISCTDSSERSAFSIFMVGDNVKMLALGSSEMSVIFNILLVSTPQTITVFMVTAVQASDIAYCKH